MFSSYFLRFDLRLIYVRSYSIKFEKSIIDYRQIPDVFYNKRKQKLPAKIFTALANAKYSFDDTIANLVMLAHFRYDYTIPSLVNRAMMHRVLMMKKRQMIPSEAIDDYGVELCVAHSIVHLGGAVKLIGSNDWIGRIAGAKNLLPKTRMKNFKIEAIDLTGTNITYEGLEYLPSLSSLKELHLGTTAFLDDHCLRRIGRMRRHLEYLDISNCPQITGKGLAALWSVRNLKVLNVANNPFLEDKELVCILLTEKIPLLQIKGVDYLAGLAPEQKARILQLLDKGHDDASGSRARLEEAETVSEREKGRLTES